MATFPGISVHKKGREIDDLNHKYAYLALKSLSMFYPTDMNLEVGAMLQSPNLRISSATSPQLIFSCLGPFYNAVAVLLPLFGRLVYRETLITSSLNPNADTSAVTTITLNVERTRERFSCEQRKAT